MSSTLSYKENLSVNCSGIVSTSSCAQMKEADCSAYCLPPAHVGLIRQLMVTHGIFCRVWHLVWYSSPAEDNNGSLMSRCRSWMGGLVNTLIARNVAFKISVVYSERLRNEMYSE